MAQLGQIRMDRIHLYRTTKNPNIVCFFSRFDTCRASLNGSQVKVLLRATGRDLYPLPWSSSGREQECSLVAEGNLRDRTDHLLSESILELIDQFQHVSNPTHLFLKILSIRKAWLLLDPAISVYQQQQQHSHLFPPSAHPHPLPKGTVLCLWDIRYNIQWWHWKAWKNPLRMFLMIKSDAMVFNFFNSSSSFSPPSLSI